MLPVFPIYANSLCVTKSVHAGALPGPAYPYFENHRSTEVHPVCWMPGPWVVKTAKVIGDSQPMVLEGHDTGMMIPHLSPIMDNILLPMTLLSSSCTFPFILSAKRCEGKAVAGFFPAYAPFVYCDSEAQKKSDKKDKDGDAPDAPKPAQPLSSDYAQSVAAKNNKVLKAGLASPRRKGAIERKVQDELNAFGEKTKVQLNISGRGRICIPAKATILMKLSLVDLLHGWTQFLASRTFDALFGAALARCKVTPPGRMKLLVKHKDARIDQIAANRLALESLKSIPDNDVMEMVWGGLGPTRKQIFEALAKDTLEKGAMDLAKSLMLDGKAKAPFGLFSYSVANGKGTFLWWGKMDGVPLPVKITKGLRGNTSAALKGICYQPAVNELVAENPNYARAPEQPPSNTPADSQPSQNQAGPSDEQLDPPPAAPWTDPYWVDPSEPSPSDAPKDYWTDPSKPSPSDDAPKDYWTDPRDVPPDYWGEPSELEEDPK